MNDLGICIYLFIFFDSSNWIAKIEIKMQNNPFLLPYDSQMALAELNMQHHEAGLQTKIKMDYRTTGS